MCVCVSGNRHIIVCLSPALSKCTFQGAGLGISMATAKRPGEVGGKKWWAVEAGSGLGCDGVDVFVVGVGGGVLVTDRHARYIDLSNSVTFLCLSGADGKQVYRFLCLCGQLRCFNMSVFSLRRSM